MVKYFESKPAGARSYIGSTTDNDLHQVRFTGGVHTLYYVLWAGKNGYKYEEDDFQGVLNTLAAACLPPSTYFPPDAPAGGGGGFTFGTFIEIVFILGAIALVGAIGFMCYKGTFPKIDLDSFALPSLSGVGRPGGRSQTNPMPTFDPGMGPISTTNGRSPLAANDSATPYTPPPA